MQQRRWSVFITNQTLLDLSPSLCSPGSHSACDPLRHQAGELCDCRGPAEADRLRLLSCHSSKYCHELFELFEYFLNYSNSNIHIVQFGIRSFSKTENIRYSNISKKTEYIRKSVYFDYSWQHLSWPQRSMTLTPGLRSRTLREQMGSCLRNVLTQFIKRIRREILDLWQD